MTDAALGQTRRFFPGLSGLRLARALAQRPRVLATRAGELAREMGRIAIGTSRSAPAKRDRRFADPAWTGNPLLRRAMQAHLAARDRAGADRDAPT